MPIPIPRKPSGYFYGSRNAAAQVEVFLDIQCPHSKLAWPSILEVRDHYDEQAIGLSVNLITLSDHRQAWDVSKGIFALAKDEDGVFFDFVTYLYDEQARFKNGAFSDKTHNELLELIAELGNEFNGFDRAEMLRLLDDSGIYQDARTPIRYASTKGVWATPTFFLNGSEQNQLSTPPTLDEWRKVIDPLV